MKPVITFVLIAFSLFFVTGCGGNQPTLTQDDSAAVAGDYVKRHPEVTTGGGAVNTFYTTNVKLRPNFRVPKDSLDNMRAAYVAHPISITDTSGKALTGFILDSADFIDIKNAITKIKTIGFHFGIRNYNYVQDKQKPVYTLMVIPVGMDWQVYPLTTATAPNVAYGYDFVDPCPGGQGCPPPTEQ